jgi:PTS system nitrogen regulatory IIA component
MNLDKCLSKDAIALQLKSTTKKDVLVEMVDLLLSGGKINNRDKVLAAIREREQKMSTGMQNGIAIPHAKSDTIDTLVAAIGLKPEGIDFDSLDGEKATIIVMTLSPTKRAGPHIQFLAEISRQLNDVNVRERMLSSSSAEDLISILTCSGSEKA